MEKEVSEAERRVKIKRIYSEKIALLIKSEIDDKELYGVIRQFFADFLKLDYEFTYEELSQELNKIFIKQGLKKRIDKLLEDLSWFEYMPLNELTQEEKKKILNDFKDIISQLILDLEEKPGKVSLFKKLFGKKKEEAAVQQQGMPDSIQTLPNLDIGDVQQKNLEMKKELYKEMFDKEMFVKEETKMPFGNLMADIDRSNNFLIVNDQAQDDMNVNKKNSDSKPTKVAIMDKNPEEFKVLKENPKSVQASNDMHGSFMLSDLHMSANAPLSPSVEDNDPELVAIKGLIEQSYKAFYSGYSESAKSKYIDALVLYNKFDYEKKTKIYLQLYELYEKLK